MEYGKPLTQVTFQAWTATTLVAWQLQRAVTQVTYGKYGIPRNKSCMAIERDMTEVYMASMERHDQIFFFLHQTKLQRFTSKNVRVLVL